MTAGEKCGGENVWCCASDRASERECALGERSRDRESDRARGADTQRERSKGTRSENEYKYVLSVLRTSVKKKKMYGKKKNKKVGKKTHTRRRENGKQHVADLFIKVIRR